MNLRWLTDQFALVTDQPGSIRTMRQAVIELAIRGRVVPQNPKDEPARVLLSRAEEIALATLTRAKYEKASLAWTQIQDQGLETLPEGWVWTCPAQIGDTSPRVSTDDDAKVGFAPMNLLPTDYRQAFTPEVRTWGEIKQGYTHFANGDVVFAKITPCFQNGKGCVMRDLPGGIGAGTTELHVLRPFSGVADPDYLLLFFKSPGFIRGGVASFTGTAGQQRVANDYFRYCPIPLPPLAEQKRIVAKVDEMMALCDELEAQQREREERKGKLVQASLARFAAAPTPDNLQFLFHKSYDIPPADLRKMILTLAVQGKLVRQEAGDGTAENMLGEILSQKSALTQKGLLKADKKPWVNSLAEPPHVIPVSWRWVRLQDVYEVSRGGSPRPAGDPRFFGGQIPWITVGEITKDTCKLLTNTSTGLTEEGAQRSRFIDPGDLLLTNSGATLGVPKISNIRGCLNDGVAVLRLFHRFNFNDFAYLYLVQQTPSFRAVNQGMGQPNLNTPIIASWFFPLPPLPEQQRIVSKVTELLALVDELERQLEESRATGAKLLEAIVRELTGTT